MAVGTLSKAFIWMFLAAVLAYPVVAGVTLDLQIEAPTNLEVFFLEDLNVSGQAPASIVFSATVISDIDPIQAYFVFIMSNSGGEIMSSQSNRFPLEPGVLHITNLDLTEDGSEWELEDYEISSNATDIKNQLLQTGYFPSDTYHLRLELHRADNDALLPADNATIVLTNPFTINLISPYGSPSSPAIVSITTPVFTWSSQATQFLLKICEKTSENSDPESVMMSRPHYETDLSDPLFMQSFLYPGSGIRPLEPYHTYYWQVTSLVQTSSGLSQYPSQIGAFTLLTQPDPELQRMLLALQRILGADFENVMGQLSGFQPSGAVREDGGIITLDELEEIATRFEQGTYRMLTVGTQ